MSYVTGEGREAAAIMRMRKRKMQTRTRTQRKRGDTHMRYAIMIKTLNCHGSNNSLYSVSQWTSECFPEVPLGPGLVHVMMSHET